MSVNILLCIFILFFINIINNLSNLDPVLTHWWMTKGSILFLFRWLRIFCKILLLSYNHENLLNLTHVLWRAPDVLNHILSYLRCFNYTVQLCIFSLFLHGSFSRHFAHIWRVYHRTEFLLISKASRKFIFRLFMWTMMDRWLFKCYLV